MSSALVSVDAPLPQGFDIPQTLQVNYPASYDTIESSWEQVYVMGNSDPAQPLLLDGEEVERTGAEGTFGVLVPLEYGDNILTFSQGDTTLSYTITRPEPLPTVEEEPEEEPEEGEEVEPTATTLTDGTQEAEAGQAVQVVSVFAGGLAAPGDDSAINETYYKGAVGVVQESVQTVRWSSDLGRNVLSWDYLLTSGDYVSAQNCVWLEGDGQSAFTGLVAEEDERGEWIRFEGTGTPAAVISCENERLSVTMYDTSFALSGAFSSELVKSAEVEQIEGGVVLHLDTQNLWGYQIDYTDGVTRLFLNRAPVRADDPSKPLSGVRVMLDPGHGDDDVGAPGIMGGEGPNEKDVNLAQAQAICYRLMQLGAEVQMLRTDDTFLTTQERLAAQIEAKPHFFLSVHHNSGMMTSDQNGSVGLQDFYHIPAGYSAPLSAQFAENLMSGVAEGTGRPASEPSWGYFNVTRTPVCPSVLFEYAFMISPTDFEDIVSTTGLYGAACGTAEGILNTVPPVAGESASAESASGSSSAPSSTTSSLAPSASSSSSAFSSAPLASSSAVLSGSSSSSPSAASSRPEESASA